MSKQSSISTSIWFRALSLDERIKLYKKSLYNKRKKRPFVREGHFFVEELKRRYPYIDKEFIDYLLVKHDISFNDFAEILKISEDSKFFKTAISPGWVFRLERAISNKTFFKPLSFPFFEGHPAFLKLLFPFLPLINATLARFRRRIEIELINDGIFSDDQNNIIELACSSLPDLLLPIVARTVILELNIGRINNTLDGATGEERFDSFCNGFQQQSEILKLLNDYPVLFRLCLHTLDSWHCANLEFFQRLKNDLKKIEAVFFSNMPCGSIVRLTAGRGDMHRGGKTVTIVEFSSGRKLVYKPRPISADVHFQELLSFLNKKNYGPFLKTFKLIDCGTYGWCEFIPFAPCESEYEVTQFYERQGAYLALFYILEATDFHHENLIALGDQPVFVDLETLFHPRISRDLMDPDPAISMLRSSVLRIGLLPHYSMNNGKADGIELSGLGGIEGQQYPFAVPKFKDVGTDMMRLEDANHETRASNNRPAYLGKEAVAIDYADSIVKGFSNLYYVIEKHKKEFLSVSGPLSNFKEDMMRIVVRSTMIYGTTRQASYHPDKLGNALERDFTLYSLWQSCKEDKHLEKILQYEIKDIRNGDIPLFMTKPGRKEIITSCNITIRNFLKVPSLSNVGIKLRSMSKIDMERQIWLIKGSLSSLSKEHAQKQSVSGTINPSELELDQEEAVQSTLSIGRYLSDIAIEGSQGGLSWLGINHVSTQRWVVAPVGPGLYDGLCGISLYLAYLGTIMKNSDFSTMARLSLQSVIDQVKKKTPRSFSVGAFDGLGGVIYLLAHLGYLRKDEDLLFYATELSNEVEEMIQYDRSFDIISGVAGCIACLIALYKVYPTKKLLNTLEKAGKFLISNALPMRTGKGWPNIIPSTSPLTGFSHGAAGIGWALVKLYDTTGIEQFKNEGIAAFDYERFCYNTAENNWPDFRKFQIEGRKHPGFEMGWCHGAPGITLSRLKCSLIVDYPEIRADAATGLSAVINRGFGFGHCLCHGDLGNIDVLLESHRVFGHAQLGILAKRRLAIILKEHSESGWRAGIPIQIESPGLMTGLSGIGLGILRVLYPKEVPSVLTLDAPIEVSL